MCYILILLTASDITYIVRRHIVLLRDNRLVFLILCSVGDKLGKFCVCQSVISSRLDLTPRYSYDRIEVLYISVNINQTVDGCLLDNAATLGQGTITS